MRKKGFTLIELMVVATIVGVLAAVAIPAYNSYIIRTSDQTCEHTAASLLTNILSYTKSTGANLDGFHGSINALNAVMPNYEFVLPAGYQAEISIANNADNIFVLVQDDKYLGTAEMNTGP